MAWRRGRSRAASGVGGGGRAGACAVVFSALLVLASPAAATRGYLTSGTNFGSIESDTFLTTSIGNTSEAMAVLGRAPEGTLYGIDDGDARDQVLRTIDKATGATTSTGPLLEDGVATELFATLAAARGGGLFATAEITAPSSANQLYRVDRSTGEATAIGPERSGVLVALAGDCGGRLLGVDADNQLVRVSRTDGSWTGIGTVAPLPPGAFPRALAYDHAAESLYLLTTEPKIYEVDPASGAVTPTTFTPSGAFMNASTLAFDAPDACRTSRTLTLSYQGGKERFSGRLAASWRPCATGEKVTVFRRRAGRDQRIGADRTDRRGRFAVSADGGGRYYATAPRSVGTDGICLLVRSKTERA
jgi:DNA-binding beta-propeller fold protein YncE